MALSEEQKLKKNARWLIVSGDASLYYGWTLASFKSYDAAYSAPTKCFQRICRETPEQVKYRRNMPELPEECYFVVEWRRTWLAKEQLDRMQQPVHIERYVDIDDRTIVHFSSNRADDALKFLRALHMLHVPYEITGVKPAEKILQSTA